MGRLLLDATLWTGCRACELICSFTKTGKFWPDRSRIRVVRLEWKGLDIPLGCHMCDPPYCLLACPTRALSQDPTTGALLLDPAYCIMCKQCVVVCPHSAIHLDQGTGELFKCDVCDGDPACVLWCETEALRWQEGGSEGEAPGPGFAEVAP